MAGSKSKTPRPDPSDLGSDDVTWRPRDEPPYVDEVGEGKRPAGPRPDPSSGSGGDGSRDPEQQDAPEEGD